MKITEVGKYKVEEQIGSGSFGKVFKGRDKLTGQVVALKVIDRRGKNKRQFESLRQQVQILKKLNHPNIVLLKDHFEAENFMILIMEYAPRDLASVLQRTVRMREEEVRRISSEILSALVYLHENRIVHRDLKPQNILLNEAGSIKICDFGFARKMSVATVCLHSMKGTPLYIAPEIIEEKPYGPKIDVWSLGIIIYELFVGTPPFLAQNFQKLTVKILRDKVLYPNNMSTELRELTDGMLQKNPNARYDWPDIQKHPFFNPPSFVPLPPPAIEVKPILIVQTKPIVVEPAIKVVEPTKPPEEQPVGKACPTVSIVPVPAVVSPKVVPNLDSYDMMFSVMLKSYEVSKSISLNNELTLQKLRQHEKQLKALTIPKFHILRIDLSFYHELMAIFNRALNTEPEQQNLELLTVACRVVILLINRVKIDDGQQDDDITRKRDLTVVVAKLIGATDSEELINEFVTVCLYLIKHTFSPMQKELDLDVSLDIIESSSKILKRPKLPEILLANICKILGTLAGQASLTVRNSGQVFKMVCENKLLGALTSRYRPEVETRTVIFECLEKFVYPIKFEHYNAEINELIATMTSDIVEELLPLIEKDPQMVNLSLKADGYVMRVLYACVKSSGEFTKAIFSKGWTKNIGLLMDAPLSNFKTSFKLCAAVIEFCAVTKYGVLLKDEPAVGEYDADDPLPVFQIALVYWYNYQHSEQQNSQKLQNVVRKIAQLLSVHNDKLEAGIKLVEGWPADHSQYTSRDLLLESLNGILQLESSVLPIIRESELIYNIPRGNKLNLKPRNILSYLAIIDQFVQVFGFDQKSFSLLQNVLSVVLTEDSVGKIRDTPQHVYTQLLTLAFSLICKLISYQEASLGDFFQRLQAQNVHRLAFLDSFMNEPSLLITLKVVVRLVRKCDMTVLDYVTVQALSKLKPFFDTRNSELLARLLLITSAVARAKADFYPKLQSLELSSKLPRYLADPDPTIRTKALNLIGNMCKHSGFFLEEFRKYGVPAAIVNTLSSAGGNQESLVFQAIFAFGNICSFAEQPQEVVAPLIQYLYQGLFVTNDAFLCNTLGTLTHLVRHGGRHVKPLLEYGLLPKVVEIVQETKSDMVQLRGLSFLQKLLDNPDVLVVYPIVDVRSSLMKAKPISSESKDRLEKILNKLGGK